MPEALENAPQSALQDAPAPTPPGGSAAGSEAVQAPPEPSPSQLESGRRRRPGSRPSGATRLERISAALPVELVSQARQAAGEGTLTSVLATALETHLGQLTDAEGKPSKSPAAPSPGAAPGAAAHLPAEVLEAIGAIGSRLDSMESRLNEMDSRIGATALHDGQIIDSMRDQMRILSLLVAATAGPLGLAEQPAFRALTNNLSKSAQKPAAKGNQK